MAAIGPYCEVFHDVLKTRAAVKHREFDTLQRKNTDTLDQNRNDSLLTPCFEYFGNSECQSQSRRLMFSV